jgi:hypothetical protein
VDHKAKTVTLQLASDEALLMDYATLVEDTGARAHQGSVRAVCDYVLARIGAALAPGGPDADVTAYWALSNLITDPSATSAASFTAGAGVSGPPTIQTSGGVSGSSFVRFSSIAAGLTVIRAASAENTSPGSTYTLSAYMRGPAGITGRVTLWIANGAGNVVQQYDSVPVTLNPSGWTRIHVSGEVTHPDAVTVQALVYGNATAAGQTFDGDGFLLTEGTELVPWFIGDQPDDAHYAYAFTGDLNESTSTRTPAVDRPPELFIWYPGVTAWDFLAPITSLVGFRLFCDELRVWRLVDPAAYDVPGYVVVSEVNATEGVDIIARDDPDVFATGVVCRFRWVDASGVARSATDTAGTPEKVVVLEYQRPYPGPGIAATILARRNGSGRTQEVQGLARWRATPGMIASINLPGALEQLGRIISVDWAVDDSGLMSLGTRGLMDVQPGSWLDWAPDDDWVDVPTDTDWEDV